jgi:hypothetical protein
MICRKGYVADRKIPEIKIPNKFYRNYGRLSFDDQAAFISGDLPTFSNGAVYADFDMMAIWI